MKKIFMIIISAVVIYSPISAYSLSCPAPMLKEKALDNASVIFEGVIVEELDWKKYRKNSKNVTTMVPEVFKVTKAYRGVEVGQEFTVYKNIYWGDISRKNYEYLIVTSEVDGSKFRIEKKIYTAPWCRNTQHYSVTEKTEEILNKYFAEK